MSLTFIYLLFFYFFKQKTAYEMRISDGSSDVCSSDLYSAWTNTLTTTIGASINTFGARTSLDAFKGLDYGGQRVLVYNSADTSAGRLATVSSPSRSEESRVGKEGVSPCISRWLADPKKKKNHKNITITEHKRDT